MQNCLNDVVYETNALGGELWVVQNQCCEKEQPEHLPLKKSKNDKQI